MLPLRRLIRARSRWFAWLAVLALAVRLLVPTGYMPAVSHGHVAIVACPGVAAMPGHDRHGDAPHAGFEQPCAFAALAAPVTAAVDAVLLVVALAIVAARALRPIAQPWRDAGLRWRPPLRGPPVILPIH